MSRLRLIGLTLALLATLGAEPRTDRYGDPLPPGAVARLGTTRLRHQQKINALALSPDSKLVASGSLDGTLRIWETTTGKLVRQLPGGDFVHQVSFTPDGKTLVASVSFPRADNKVNEVRLWDAATGREMGRIRYRVARTFAFSADGKILAMDGFLAGDKDYSIRLWDVAAGRELRRLSCRHSIEALAFSPDGKHLASGHSVYEDSAKTGEIGVWEVATGRQLHRLHDPDGKVIALAFSGDGKRIVAGIEPGATPSTVHLWEAVSGKRLPPRREQGVGDVLALTRLHDGRVLALRRSRGHTAGRIEDTETGKKLGELHGPNEQYVAAFSDDGKIVAGSCSCALELWDARTGKPLTPTVGHTHELRSIHYAPDGRTVATQGRSVRLWQPASGRAIRSMDVRGEVAFSPDFRFLAAVNPGPVRLWEVGGDKEIRRFGGKEERPYCAAYSPDGKTIATGGYRMEVLLWDAASGRRLRRCDGDSSDGIRNLTRIAFTPDGKTLIAQDTFGPVYFWDVATGKPCPRFAGKGDLSDAFAVSPDGELLALSDAESGGDGGEKAITLWELTTGKRRGVVKHRGRQWGLRFSPDGRTLAVSASEHILLYEVASGKVRLRLPGEAPFDFAPDGRALAAADGRTSALIWDVTGRRREGESRLSPTELRALWADLASDDAAKAYRAVWRLAAAPADAVPMLRDALKPIAPADPALLTRLIRDLDSDRYDVRERAERGIEERLWLAEPALRRALGEKPSLELRRRVERLLRLLEWPVRSPGVLRELRAVEALEYIGTPEAKEVLRGLAGGAPPAPLTREAQAALRRLERR